MLHSSTLVTSRERKGFKECETILWINAEKWHLFFFLLLPFYHSSCCQSVRKLIYPSSNLSRWWVTKLSETFVVFLHVPSTLCDVCILTVAYSLLHEEDKEKSTTWEDHSKTCMGGLPSQLRVVIVVLLGFFNPHLGEVSPSRSASFYCNVDHLGFRLWTILQRQSGDHNQKQVQNLKLGRKKKPNILSSAACFQFYHSVFLPRYLKPVIHFTKQNILRDKREWKGAERL